MGEIIIDKEILRCAINDLTLTEVQLTLEAGGIFVDRKDKKHQLVDKVMKLLEDKMLSEEVYLSIKTKAFSSSTDFYDGFFYKYNTENVDFCYESFMELLEKQGKDENLSKQSNITFEYKFYNRNHDSENKIVKFTFSRESRKGIYDYKDDGVKFFHNKIQANIEIYYDNGLVYIHSKNSTDSTTIKFLLQKVINKLLVDKNKGKIKLSTPKFDNTIVEKWSRDNKFNVNGISVISIHMLDLLYEFEKESQGFSRVGIKRIYLEHEVIDTNEDSRILGHIVWGENLQKRNEILQELNKGKKIKGFELEVNYQYEDEENGIEDVIPVVISIVQDNNNSIRISLSNELVNTNNFILSEIYEKLKVVFLNKIKSKNIENTDNLKNFLSRCRNTNETKKEDSTERVKSRAVY